MSDETHSIILTGLDGSNPLAFMAALGTFRLLSKNENLRMSWHRILNQWKPKIEGFAEPVQPELILTKLDSILSKKSESHPILIWENFIKNRGSLLSKFSGIQTASESIDSEELNFMSAIGSTSINDGQKDYFDSQFRASRTDYHSGVLKKIIASCDKAHLERTLFKRWDYNDPIAGHSLRIEPGEDKRHAYQWNQPTSDSTRSKRGNMLGANRLAIEAFPYFQSVEINNRIATTCFKGRTSGNTVLSWPIWNTPIPEPVLSSVLRMKELTEKQPNSKTLERRGICAVFRSRRPTFEKNRYFTPSIQIS